MTTTTKTRFAVITRPGYGHGNKLTVASSHASKEAADKKATTWNGYMVIESDAKKGETVYADSIR